MNEPVLDPSPVLPRFLVRAIMNEAAHAVERINFAGAIQLQQPAQAPAEAEAFRERLIATVLEPIFSLWNALWDDALQAVFPPEKVPPEMAHLRQAGAHLALALIREMLTTSAQGIAVLRQFQNPAPPAESSSPAPGSGA